MRLRLLVLVASAATLLAGLPALGASGRDDRTALALLTDAAHAARTRSYRGTQYVGSWRAGTQQVAVLDVDHRPGDGSTVRPSGMPAGDTDTALHVPTADLDERLLRLLDASYTLQVSGPGRVAGRATTVVEARRVGQDGPGAVAGRFWIDDSTGLMLRREVYDQAGNRLRSSAFVDVTVATAPERLPVGVLPPDGVTGRRLDPAELGAIGWRPPQVLPGGLELFDSRMTQYQDAQVLHLAYSDGLSTLSVFSQRGSVDEQPGADFRPGRMAGTRVWVQQGAPERLVWQGDGQVFTVVTDADPAVVPAAVAALPHDRPDDGLLSRLGRGLRRIGHWLNPFD